VGAEDAPDQSSAVEKAADRALGIVTCSETQLRSDRSDQILLLCLRRGFSHSLKAAGAGLTGLFPGNLLICSVKTVFRIILGLESRQGEVVLRGPNGVQPFSQDRPGGLLWRP